MSRLDLNGLEQVCKELLGWQDFLKNLCLSIRIKQQIAVTPHFRKGQKSSLNIHARLVDGY